MAVARGFAYPNDSVVPDKLSDAVEDEGETHPEENHGEDDEDDDDVLGVDQP